LLLLLLQLNQKYPLPTGDGDRFGMTSQSRDTAGDNKAPSVGRRARLMCERVSPSTERRLTRSLA